MNFRYALAGLVAAGAAIIPAASAHAAAPVHVPAASTFSPTIVTMPISSGFVVAPAVQGTTAVQVAPSSAVQQTAPASGSLPFTGGDVAGLTAAGLGLLGAGMVLVRRNRVRSGEVRA